jgi:hypothetical protein
MNTQIGVPNWWSLSACGCYSEVFVSSGWTVQSNSIITLPAHVYNKQKCVDIGSQIKHFHGFWWFGEIR